MPTDQACVACGAPRPQRAILSKTHTLASIKLKAHICNGCAQPHLDDPLPGISEEDDGLFISSGAPDTLLPAYPIEDSLFEDLRDGDG